MPFKIVRNDITKMQTEAIVNTANAQPAVGDGCDRAVYEAAGREELLDYRKKHIGAAEEGSVFLTPGFRLPARVIIHAVSPLYIDGNHGEEELLRSCYRESLQLASENSIASVAVPLISTGSFGFPREEGLRIAVDEIRAFLLSSDMEVYLVVFDEKAARLGKELYPDLEAYIDLHYVQEKLAEEYSGFFGMSAARQEAAEEEDFSSARPDSLKEHRRRRFPWPRREDRPPAGGAAAARPPAPSSVRPPAPSSARPPVPGAAGPSAPPARPSYAREDYAREDYAEEDAAFEEMERKLAERLEHISDTFPQYLLYLIRLKGMENAEVYKRAIVDKKVFSKIKNNPDYHPQKLTALCLCVGACLTMDETRDLLARAGYALSPCDKTDIIFSYFIEHGIYDMIELDIQLEEHGLPCIIT